MTPLTSARDTGLVFASAGTLLLIAETNTDHAVNIVKNVLENMVRNVGTENLLLEAFELSQSYIEKSLR